MDNIPDESWEKFENLDLWVVDCLRHTPSPSHAKLETTLGWIEKLKPKQAILTHMSHDFDYDTLNSALPAHITPAYDGMVIEC